jgi:uncharacterized repeat protein (TIGR01451 family)
MNGINLIERKRGTRMVLVALVIGIATLAFNAVAALADASDPNLNSTSGNVTWNTDGSRTVTVQGGWNWNTHKSDCNNDKRAVGYAVSWGDPSAAGNVVTTLNGKQIAVGTPSDNVVHPAMPGTDTSDANAWRGGCGTFSSSAGYNSGTWGPISHTYPASYTGDVTICVLMYDVHLKSNGGAPNNGNEITAGGGGHNGDNSAEGNKDTPLGNGCFTTTLTTPPKTPTPPPTPNTPPPTPTPPSNPTPPSTPPTEPTPPPTPSTPTDNPALSIVKTERIGSSGSYVRGPLTSNVGQTVDYRIVVKNTGNVSLAVTLSDALCDTGTLAPAGAQNLAAGASLAYTCKHQLVKADAGSFTNTASATGTTSAGATVGPFSSKVVVKVSESAVLGAHKVVVHKRKAARKKVKTVHHVKVVKHVHKVVHVKAVKKVAHFAKPATPLIKSAAFTG